MKVQGINPKPRNPLVAPALLRRAGRHQATPGAERQRAQREARRELEQFAPPKHSP